MAGRTDSQNLEDDPRYTITTVCTGNICRSPMAEIILRKYAEDEGLADSVRVMSSGISDEEYSHPIDPRAVRVLRARGYEIPKHHFAHAITRGEIDATDLFLPMTASHMRSLLRMLPPEDRSKVHMYRSFDPNLATPAPGKEYEIDLVDPWYGGPEDFEIAINQIEEVAPYIIDWVKGEIGR
ncbi:low molecular weight protein-tyrosine-phosphatase [Pseudoscardovia radai]|uniref:low molecular weight protein-tyrosine-phosphatase n=1 Tax=Pseudoscardovia radai TaxID=987066 RepID=UPI003993A493